MPSTAEDAAGRDPVAALCDVLCRALTRLADAGEADAACRLGAEAWSRLRSDRPREAQRLNGLLHALVHRLSPETSAPRPSESHEGR